MLIILTGPTGSGKTDTGWALLSLMGRLVFLDCDWFASRVPFDWTNPVDVNSVYRALNQQIGFHLTNGRTRFVITLTLEMAVLFERHRADFALPASQVHPFRLICSPDVLTQRIIDRDRDQWNIEMANAVKQSDVYNRSFPDDRLFRIIDTTEVTTEAVAHQIAQLAGLLP